MTARRARTAAIVGNGVENGGIGGVVPTDGSTGDGVGFVEMPLAYGVENFQVRYVMEDGTTVDDIAPSVDADGNPIAYNLVMDWHELELTSWAYVETLAAKATEQFGTRHIPTQRGNRFGIGTVPSIGDKVSYTINADYTPCGEVERITPSLTVITTSGMRFRRLKKTGGWVREGTTYCYLVAGHIDERNPEV